MVKVINPGKKKRLLPAKHVIKTITKSRNNKKEYLVHWQDYKEPTWEPRVELLKDKCHELIKRVDQFEAEKSKKSFFKWQEKKYACDDENRYVFSSLEIAMKLINNDGWYQRELEIEFRNNKSANIKDCDDGLTLNQVNGFVNYCNKRVNGTIKQINKKVFYKNLLGDCGAGIEVMTSKSWEIGVYFFSAYNNHGIGHCFVLEVDASKLPYIHDPNEEESRLRLLENGDWIQSWGFVKRIEKLDK